MKNYNVLKTEQNRNGIICHTIAGYDEKQYYSSIVGGLSWPVGKTPAYFCIIGKKHFAETVFEGRKSPGKIIILFEKEVDSLSMDDVFLHITDACTLLGCDTVYADISEKFKDFIELYEDYSYNNKISSVSIDQAPFSDNFLLGLSLINDRCKSGVLRIADGLVIHKQLKIIGRPDLEDMPEERFNAINALRFALSAIHKYGQKCSYVGFQPQR